MIQYKFILKGISYFLLSALFMSICLSSCNIFTTPTPIVPSESGDPPSGNEPYIDKINGLFENWSFNLFDYSPTFYGSNFTYRENILTNQAVLVKFHFTGTNDFFMGFEGGIKDTYSYRKIGITNSISLLIQYSGNLDYEKPAIELYGNALEKEKTYFGVYAINLTDEDAKFFFYYWDAKEEYNDLQQYLSFTDTFTEWTDKKWQFIVDSGDADQTDIIESFSIIHFDKIIPGIELITLDRATSQ